MRLSFKQFKDVLKDIGFNVYDVTVVLPMGIDHKELIFKHRDRKCSIGSQKWPQTHQMDSAHIAYAERIVEMYQIRPDIRPFTFVEYILRKEIRNLKKKVRNAYD